jgi:hypothetical protein
VHLDGVEETDHVVAVLIVERQRPCFWSS